MRRNLLARPIGRAAAVTVEPMNQQQTRFVSLCAQFLSLGLLLRPARI